MNTVDPSNRYRFLKELVEAILEVFPDDRVGVRLSPNGVYGSMGSEDNHDLFIFVSEKLSAYNLAYLHVMDGVGFGFHNKCARLTLFDAKKAFKGPVMGNVLFTKDTAESALRSGAADLISFGRPFIANPDLVERFTNNWSLAPEAPFSDWYFHEDKNEGYTTYPAYVVPETGVRESSV